MFLARLRLAVFTVILVSSPIASASKNPLQSIAGSKPLNSLWQKALPVMFSAVILLAPPSLDALPNHSLPQHIEIPSAARQEDESKEYVGRAVFFESNGVGQQGVVGQIDGFTAHIHQTTGVAEDGVTTDIVIIPVEQIEAKLHWPYEVIGNFVAFVPDGNTHGLDTKTVYVPQRIGVSEYGGLNIEPDNVKEVNITLGTVTAVTDDGRYVIKPYHFTPFAPDPHDSDSSHVSEPNARRDALPLSLGAKHFHNLNTGLHLVSKENIVSGLEQVLLEETEISEPFFAFLARDDRKREANFAARKEGLPLPYKNITPPLVSDYQTTSYTAEDFVDKIIYYYDKGNKYLAHAVDQHEGKVVVLLSGGKSTKHIAVEQIRAASYADDKGWSGNGISFFGANAFPLSHTVHWQGLYLPGARSGIWEEKVANGSVVTALDNGLLVVKVIANSVNGMFVNYQLYLLLQGGQGLVHYGNHHHRTGK